MLFSLEHVSLVCRKKLTIFVQPHRSLRQSPVIHESWNFQPADIDAKNLAAATDRPGCANPRHWAEPKWRKILEHHRSLVPAAIIHNVKRSSWRPPSRAIGETSFTRFYDRQSCLSSYFMRVLYSQLCPVVRESTIVFPAILFDLSIWNIWKILVNAHIAFISHWHKGVLVILHFHTRRAWQGSEKPYFRTIPGAYVEIWYFNRATFDLSFCIALPCIDPLHPWQIWK